MRRTTVRLGLFVAGVGLIVGLASVRSGGTSLVNAPDIAWDRPTDSHVNNLGPTTAGSRSHDCTALTYRMRGDLSKTMHDGCFVRTAFGLVDAEQSLAIFTGTDEAEPIQYGGSPAAISALPESAAVARFGGFPGQGTYMYLYTYFPGNLQQAHDWHLQPYKEIIGEPNYTVNGPDGLPLPVNPSALSYAAGGQWLVTESPGHALVRINLATFDVLPFGDAYDEVGKPFATHTASLAITEDGRYAAAANNQFSEFMVLDLQDCSAPGKDVLSSRQCRKHNYWNYLAGQVTGQLRSVSHVHFVSDRVIGFTALTTSGTEDYLLSPDGPITSLTPYLGMGDSFASGQGAFDYLSGTDTADNRCHVSPHAYPLLLNADLFGGQGHSVACSGAVIHDIASTSQSYTGQSSLQKSAERLEADGSEVTIIHDYRPGYLAQQRFVTAAQPEVMTVQIGGNDVGFGDMLLKCLSPVVPEKRPETNPNSCYATYEDRLEIAQLINRRYSQWVSLYRQLRQQAPLARVYAIGYPQIMSGTGRCGLNTPATDGDIAFARDVTNYLNATIAKAASAAGVVYVDTTNAFAGRELCSGNKQPAVNGLTAGTDKLGVLGQESFHPNQAGHQLLEQAILQNSQRLTKAMPTATPTVITEPVPSPSDPLLQAPASGRPVRSVSYRSDLLPRTSQAGTTVTIKADGVISGFAPYSSVRVTVDGATAGSASATQQGDATITVKLPLSNSPQLICAESVNIAGDQVAICQVLPGNGAGISPLAPNTPASTPTTAAVVGNENIAKTDTEKVSPSPIGQPCVSCTVTITANPQPPAPAASNPVTVSPQTTPITIPASVGLVGGSAVTSTLPVVAAPSVTPVPAASSLAGKVTVENAAQFTRLGHQRREPLQLAKAAATIRRSHIGNQTSSLANVSIAHTAQPKAWPVLRRIDWLIYILIIIVLLLFRCLSQVIVSGRKQPARTRS